MLRNSILDFLFTRVTPVARERNPAAPTRRRSVSEGSGLCLPRRATQGQRLEPSLTTAMIRKELHDFQES